MRGLLLNGDEHIAAWAFKTYNRVPMKFDRAIGIIDDVGLVGAALFLHYNGVNAEFAYYGTDSLTLGIIKGLSKIALYQLKLSRCTIIVPKRPTFLLRKLPKFGFRYEGVQRRYYGPTDADKHMGCRFVAFREDIERLAGLKTKKVERNVPINEQQQPERAADGQPANDQLH
jgi:hypothetical protein